MENYQRIFRSRPSNHRLVNYEGEVYKLVYGKNPPANLQLNYRRPKKEHRNLYWDNMIDEDVIDELMKLPNIEIIDVNQGNDSKLLTHFIFQPINQDQDYINRIAGQLNVGITKAKFGLGIGDRTIVYVATKNWYRPHANNKALYDWWKALPSKIRKSI